MNHIAVQAPLSLRDFCSRFCQILNLPGCEFGFEDATEWGLVEVNNIEYNISRPYEEGTLQEWDDTVPVGCNFGISLILYREHPNARDIDWPFSNLVVPVCRQIAIGFGIPVHFHRTWLGMGHNVRRTQTFQPDMD